MKRHVSRYSLAVVFMFAVSVFLAASNAYASYPPYLTFGGNYDYIYDADTDTGQLNFTYNTADWIDYTNGDFACPWCDNPDAVIGADIVIGMLYNSSSTPLVFGGPVSFSLRKDGTDFFTADLSNFVVANSEMTSGSLTNVSRNGSAPYSRYISETGSNDLMLYMSFTPDGGGSEDFTVSSSGSVGGTISVAPEPVSAILFIAGGATLAFRRQRKSA